MAREDRRLLRAAAHGERTPAAGTDGELTAMTTRLQSDAVRIVRTSSPCRGAGRIGSVSCDCAFFCTSTSLTSSAGDEADTGTPPLSAPQIAVEDVRLVAGRDESLPNADSGVPIRSTPRTSSGGAIVGVDRDRRRSAAR